MLRSRSKRTTSSIDQLLFTVVVEADEEDEDEPFFFFFLFLFFVVELLELVEFDIPNAPAISLPVRLLC